MDKRPQLNKKITIKDFEDFYWLKEELMKFCRTEGLPISGSKIELANRIKKYLLTGLKGEQLVKKRKTNSSFDWKKEQLTLDTLITDNYKNSENVRVFFESHIGNQFKFNVKFMNWMKTNAGKTLAEAIVKWKELKEHSKQNKDPKEIAPQFEYNRYLRDFLKDNPDRNRKTGIQLWKIKRSRRGDNVYRKADLKWLE